MSVGTEPHVYLNIRSQEVTCIIKTTLGPTRRFICTETGRKSVAEA